MPHLLLIKVWRHPGCNYKLKSHIGSNLSFVKEKSYMFWTNHYFSTNRNRIFIAAQVHATDSCLVRLSHRVHSTRLVVRAHGFQRCQPDGGALERPPPGDTKCHWWLASPGQQPLGYNCWWLPSHTMKIKSTKRSTQREAERTLASDRVLSDKWGDEGGRNWRDELSVVIGELAELFASPGQESCQSAVRVVRDADHVPVGPHLQTD